MTTRTPSRGRKPDAGSKSGKIRELLKTGMPPTDIAKAVGCTPALVYNVKARAGGPGAPKAVRKPKAGSPPANTDGLAQILAAVKATEEQRNRMRSALERVAAIVREALG